MAARSWEGPRESPEGSVEFVKRARKVTTVILAQGRSRCAANGAPRNARSKVVRVLVTVKVKVKVKTNECRYVMRLNMSQSPHNICYGEWQEQHTVMRKENKPPALKSIS